MKMRSNTRWEVERYKRGRRNYGDIVKMRANGRRLYLATRLMKEIYRGGKPTISEALRQGVAAWALDNDTLWEMKHRGIKVVGIYVRDTGDIYLTSLDNFFDPSKASIRDYGRRGGSMQRFLPLEFFRRKPGQIRKL